MHLYGDYLGIDDMSPFYRLDQMLSGISLTQMCEVTSAPRREVTGQQARFAWFQDWNPANVLLVRRLPFLVTDYGRLKRVWLGTELTAGRASDFFCFWDLDGIFTSKSCLCDDVPAEPWPGLPHLCDMLDKINPLAIWRLFIEGYGLTAQCVLPSRLRSSVVHCMLWFVYSFAAL